MADDMSMTNPIIINALTLFRSVILSHHPGAHEWLASADAGLACARLPFNPPADHPQALPFEEVRRAAGAPITSGVPTETIAELRRLCEEAEMQDSSWPWNWPESLLTWAKHIKIDRIPVNAPTQFSERWIVFDESKSEPEINWPGEYLGDFEHEWEAIGFRDRVILDALLALLRPGDSLDTHQDGGQESGR